jgi:hypothetical protein
VSRGGPLSNGVRLMRGRQLKADVVVSAVFAVIRIAVLLWIVRGAGEVMSVAALGAFLLARRVASTAANLLHLGSSQTLRRYISMNAGDREMKFAYVGLALAGWALLTVLVLALAHVLEVPLARWTFPGSPSAESLAFWSVVYAMSLVLSFVVTTTMTAERRMALANAMDTLAAGGYLVLPLVLYDGPLSPTWLLRFHALVTIGASLLVLGWYLAQLRVNRLPGGARTRQVAADFRDYGLPRTFVNFADMLTLSVGPWLLRAHPAEAGYLLIALQLTRSIQAAIQPLTQVAGVVTARLAASNDDALLGDGIKLLFGTVLYASTLTVAVTTPWREPLLRLWLGDATLVGGVRFYFDVLMWAIIPYVAFQGLKSVIEMRWVRPLNLYSLIGANALYILLFAGLEPYVGSRVAARDSTLIAFVALGAVSVFWCRRYLRPARYLGLARLLLAAGAVAAVNSTAARHGSVVSVGVAAVLSLVVAAALVGVHPAPYVRAVRDFLLPAATPGRASAQ